MNRAPRSYANSVERGRYKYGDKWSNVSIDERFIPYFESQERIEIEIDGDRETGYVGITTGWQPVFILLKTSRSKGGATTLDKRVKLITGRKFKITINKPE